MTTAETKKSASAPSSKRPYDPLNTGTPDEEFNYLITQVKSYMDTAEAEDKLREAYLFAAERHQHQSRASGEPYITHPLAVAIILTDLRIDLASLIAAILHDTVEDTETTLEEVEELFGKPVAELVDGLTKIGKIKFRSKQEKLAENFRKMVLAMAKDLRVILVKLADRLHNMRTLNSLPEEKRVRIAQETLDIYAPLANRLGIYGIKSELEDLCLKEVKNKAYKEISAKIDAKREARQAYISDVIDILTQELEKYGFKDAKVYGRPKHFYSIYKKMMDRRLTFEDIHDLFAFRIIVKSVKDCYEALGVVHAMWKPMPGRFKDYIAMPKANLYQSLHTTVIRPNGEPAEIQIRTEDMHKVSEFGVAAHWAYKDRKKVTPNSTDLQKFSWLRQIMEWQSELTDPLEFLEAVKVDLFDEEIFVFTPKGDVLQLPSKATALDFAFAVHTDIGVHTIGAKVNGRMVQLRRPLNSGDIIEVLTSSNQKPNKDWLNFVTTSKAKNKIRSHLRTEQRNRSKTIGKELLASALTNRGMNFDKLKNNQTEELVKIGKEARIDDVLVAIGYGKLDAPEIVAKAFPQKENSSRPGIESDLKQSRIYDRASDGSRGEPAAVKRNASGVLVSGMDNILVSFARCCNPLPGDDIIGFITRGRGVTIHRQDCPRGLDMDPARKIEVTWASQSTDLAQHTAFLKIETKDRQGMLAEVTMAISACGANIKKANIQISNDLVGVLDFEVNVQSLTQLKEVIKKTENIPGVLSVQRRSISSKSKKKKSPNR